MFIFSSNSISPISIISNKYVSCVEIAVNLKNTTFCIGSLGCNVIKYLNILDMANAVLEPKNIHHKAKFVKLLIK